MEIVPAGTTIDGKRMYEEGEIVKLTASNNKIMTFTGWEDNSTDMERIITMNANQNLTANFSAVDYIVGGTSTTTNRALTVLPTTRPTQRMPACSRCARPTERHRVG